MNYITEHIDLLLRNIASTERSMAQPNKECYLIHEDILVDCCKEIQESMFNDINITYYVAIVDKPEYKNGCYCLHMFPVKVVITILYIGSEFIGFETVRIAWKTDDESQITSLQEHINGKKTYNKLINEISERLLETTKTLIVDH